MAVPNNNDGNRRSPPAKGGSLGLPSLDDSPLWRDDFEPVEKPKEKEETPPLFIIRDKFPRIALSIELNWGTPDMEEYFEKMIVDDRGNRAGFPKDVMDAMLTLYTDHLKRFKFAKKSGGAEKWTADSYQKHVYRG